MASKFPGQASFLAATALSLVLAACSSPESDVKSKLRLTRPEWTPPVKPSGEAKVALGPEDFIGPDGRCPGDPAAAAAQPAPTALQFQSGPEAGPGAPPAAPGVAQPAPQLGRGITLDMSECDVVRAVGSTGQVEISTNERGERTVVMTYLQGDRPGIYRFVSGRLKTMERAPEPPASAKPAPRKPKKPASS